MRLPRPDEWVFFRDSNERWRWRHRRGDAILQEASRGFDTRDDCIADAEHNGFLAGPVTTEFSIAPR
jgi:hypothetical protein